MEAVTDFIFLGSKITTDGDSSHEIKMLAPWKESYDKPRQCTPSLPTLWVDCSISADNTTLMAERKEELKSLLMRVKEESEKAGLKLNIQKMKIMTSGAIPSQQIDEEDRKSVV